MSKVSACWVSHVRVGVLVFEYLIRDFSETQNHDIVQGSNHQCITVLARNTSRVYLVASFQTNLNKPDCDPNAYVNGDGVVDMKGIAIAVYCFHKNE